MKTQHTPGPWIFAFGSVYQGDNWATLEEHAGRIAQADRDNPHTTPTERDANCRLIAAAPCLLEACQMAVARLAVLEQGSTLVETLDKAIAKAQSL